MNRQGSAFALGGSRAVFVPIAVWPHQDARKSVRTGLPIWITDRRCASFAFLLGLILILVKMAYAFLPCKRPPVVVSILQQEALYFIVCLTGYSSHFKSERDCDFLFTHGHDFSIIPSWKNVILSRRAPPKQAILQIQNTRRYSYETER